MLISTFLQLNIKAQLFSPPCCWVFTQVELGRKQEVVVYDQNSKEAGHLSKDGFVHILMGKLESTFHRVSLLTGNVTVCDGCPNVFICVCMCDWYAVLLSNLHSYRSCITTSVFRCCNCRVSSVDVSNEYICFQSLI